MFRSQQQPEPTSSSASANTSSTSQSESPITRVDRALKHIRRGKSIHQRRRNYKPYSSGKEVQKGLVLIDFQGDHPTDVLPLREYEKLYDGCMRYRSDMKEDEIRDEITRLLKQKRSDTHNLDLLTPEDFDFV